MAGKYRTWKRGQSEVNKLRDYTDKKLCKRDLAFHEITLQFLPTYESYLRTNGNAITTVHSDLCKMRAIMNMAVREGEVPINKNPFKVFRNQFKAPQEGQG